MRRWWVCSTNARYSMGGSILPTEATHLHDEATKVTVYLQVAVKQDMKIQIPEEVFGVKQWECTVVSTKCSNVYQRTYSV